MYITLFYAGLLAIVLLVLSYRVVQLRRQGVSLGDGGDMALQRRIRAHANFTEYVPIILLIMALLEMNQTSAYLLHAIGLSLFVARCLHGYAMSFTDTFFFGRFSGTLVTFLLLLVCGGLGIVAFLNH